MTPANLSNLFLSTTGQQVPQHPVVSDAQRAEPAPCGAVPDSFPRFVERSAANTADASAYAARPAAQDDDFFTGLFLRYGPGVRAYVARRLSADRETAQDIVQIVFLRAWRWRRCLQALTPRQRQAWLARTAQRCVVDAWRDRRATPATHGSLDVTGGRGVISFTHLTALYSSDPAQGAGDGDTPDERVERALAVASQYTLSVQQRTLGLDEAVCTRLDARDRVTRLLARLAPEEARLLLRVGAGATIDELQAESARRGAPASRGAITMRVKRARASARRVWGTLTAEPTDIGLDTRAGTCAGTSSLTPPDEQVHPMGAEHPLHPLSSGCGANGDHPHDRLRDRLGDPARIGGVA